MMALLRRALARLRVPPFEGRWTPQVLEQNVLDVEVTAADRTR